MSELKTTMDVFKILEKSNCRECGAPTCLAFAAAVIQGGKSLGDCTRLDPDMVAGYGPVTTSQPAIAQDMDKAVAQLKEQVRKLDLARLAPQLGGEFIDGRLRLKIMGKDFFVDPEGNLASGIHLHSWVTLTLLGYVVNCQGRPIKGQWVPFRELPGGREMAGLFGQSCEKPLKKVADNYTDLFEDMIDIFGGRPADDMFNSDIAVILDPLPMVPVLICYWEPEDGMESNLNLFFDTTAVDNMTLENVYSLGAGLTQMFVKIARTHLG